MRMTEIVELIDTETTHNEVGMPIKTETRTEVYAEKMSARRSEHYAANAAGQRVDIVFAVMADEYNDEAELDYNGKRYKVVRAYADQAWRGRVELTCAVE